MAKPASGLLRDGGLSRQVPLYIKKLTPARDIRDYTNCINCIKYLIKVLNLNKLTCLGSSVKIVHHNLVKSYYTVCACELEYGRMVVT